MLTRYVKLGRYIRRLGTPDPEKRMGRMRSSSPTCRRCQQAHTNKDSSYRLEPKEPQIAIAESSVSPVLQNFLQQRFRLREMCQCINFRNTLQWARKGYDCEEWVLLCCALSITHHTDLEIAHEGYIYFIHLCCTLLLVAATFSILSQGINPELLEEYFNLLDIDRKKDLRARLVSVKCLI